MYIITMTMLYLVLYSSLNIINIVTLYLRKIYLQLWKSRFCT